MAIVPTDQPMTAPLAAQTIQQLTQRYPFIHQEVIGFSVLGQSIPALSLGVGPRRVLYTATFHGNEWITTPLLLKFIAQYATAVESDGLIAQRSARQLFRECTIYLVPMVNPDGADLVTGRWVPGDEAYDRALGFSRNYPTIPFPQGWKANLNGVNLNLQFPAGWLTAREIKFSQGYTRPGPRDYVGRAPLDQPESRCLSVYTCRVDPDLVLAYHTQGQVIYYQYGDIFIPGAQELAERFAQLSGYQVSQTPYASSFAGYKDWFIRSFHRPGFTIEAGSGVNPLPIGDFDAIYQENLPILVAAASG